MKLKLHVKKVVYVSFGPNKSAINVCITRNY